MADSITLLAAEAYENNADSSLKMTFHKINFNMPVEDLFSNISGWIRFSGPFNYTGTATSFDLSDFSPGFEVAGFGAIWDYDNTSSGSERNIDTDVYFKFYDTDGSTILYTAWNGDNVTATVAANDWWEFMGVLTQGVASWEIDQAGTFYLKAWSGGVDTIATVSQAYTFSNVPSVTELSSSKAGYIWVEGNDLCYVTPGIGGTGYWKHTMVGTFVSSSPGVSKAGYIWIDGTDLHWVGNDGYDYKAAWKIKQFASSFNNSATGETYAGTSKYGFIWADSEFGGTHLAYIASDGYKYLTGAGVDPYA